MTTLTTDELYAGWVQAVEVDGDRWRATTYARALADAMARGDDEPDWCEREKSAYLAWCDAYAGDGY